MSTKAELFQNLAVQLRGAADTVAEIARLEDMPPVDPPPPPEPPVLTVSGNPLTLSEESPSTTIVATLSKPATADVTVVLSCRGIGILVTESIVITAGSLAASKSMTVTTFPDVDAELSVSVLSAAGTTFDPTAILTFQVKAKAPPPPPPKPTLTLSLDRSSVAEGEVARITATLSSPRLTDTVVPLHYRGTATPGIDVTVPESITILAGNIASSMPVTAIDDTADEISETLEFLAGLSDIYDDASGPVVLTIEDNDEPPPPDPDPVPDDGPPPIATDWTLRAHPRLWWTDDISARLAAAPASIMANLKKVADAPQQNTNRLMCRVVRYRLGEAAYGPLAVTDLMAFVAAKDVELAAGNDLISTHYTISHLQEIAIAYDWLWELLTPEQRTKICLTCLARLKRGLDNGYNADYGKGLITRIAIDGDIPETVDCIKSAWQTTYWGTQPAGSSGGLYNAGYSREYFPHGGMREGVGYFSDNVPVFAAYEAWLRATGDRSFEIPWKTEAAQAIIYQVRPLGTQIRSQPENEILTTTGHGRMIQLAIGHQDPKVAQLAAWFWDKNKANYSNCTEFEWFLYTVLIGDPRIKPADPASLDIPLVHSNGHDLWARDKWTWGGDYVQASFGCSEFQCRKNNWGDIFIVSKDRILVASRSSCWRHNYAPITARSIPTLWIGEVLQTPLSGDDTPRRTRMSDGIKQIGPNKWVCDLRLWYKDRNRIPPIEVFTRTLEIRDNNRTFVVTDELKADPRLDLWLPWNMPEQPVINDDGTVTQVNGVATLLTSFAEHPEQVFVRGGYTDYLFAQDRLGLVSDKVKTDLGLLFQKAPKEAQLAEGGFFTLWAKAKRHADGRQVIETTFRVP